MSGYLSFLCKSDGNSLQTHSNVIVDLVYPGADILSREHDISSRAHDILSHAHDIISRAHDISIILVHFARHLHRCKQDTDIRNVWILWYPFFPLPFSLSFLSNYDDWIQRWRLLLYQNVHLYEGLICKDSTEMTLRNDYNKLRLQNWSYHPLLESQWIPLHFCGERWGYSSVYMQIMSCARDHKSCTRDIMSCARDNMSCAWDILSCARHNFFQKNPPKFACPKNTTVPNPLLIYSK